MKQRGFGVLELGMALGILVAAGALVYGVKSYLEGIRTTADKAGYDRALKEVAQRDKKELEDSQALIASLTLERDTNAALHATEQARLKRVRDKEIADAKAENDRMRAGIASGSIVLRDPGRAGEGSAWRLNQDGNSGRGQAGATTTVAGGSGQATGTELSRSLSANLWAEAERADEIRADLALCWGIAKDDRIRISSPTPISH